MFIKISEFFQMVHYDDLSTRRVNYRFCSPSPAALSFVGRFCSLKAMIDNVTSVITTLFFLYRPIDLRLIGTYL